MDLTPPWVAEQVRRAQAFIDRAWAEHVHETEHATQPGWRVEPDVILYNSIGEIQLVHAECRYCRIAALTESLRPRYEQQPPPCECGDCGTTEPKGPS